MWTPPDDIDVECRNLCIALNSLDGIETTNSCYGHGTSPFRIWFHVETLHCEGMLLLARLVSHNYGPFGHWTVKLQHTDIVRTATTFCLEGPPGDASYREAEAMCQWIAECLNSVGWGKWIECHKPMWDREKLILMGINPDDTSSVGESGRDGKWTLL